MKILCLFFACFICFSRSQIWDPHKYKFSKEFMFGVSTSAYQIEGAYNEDGKGESIWDRHFQQRSDPNMAERIPGQEACDSYHQYQRDVEMLRELGVQFYRFSISWSRILPTGFSNEINEKGLLYYDNLIRELLKYNIKPMVTMYHFDLPQRLQDLGGWANPNIIKWFEDYAIVLFNNFPMVDYWITINQPSVCFESYGGGDMAPALDFKGHQDYMCLKNMLLAHANVYKMFERHYRKNMKSAAKVGISLSLNWADPMKHKKSNEELNKATQLFREFTIDLCVHPIFSEKGGFPKSVIDAVANNSRKEGYTTSRLPKLTPDEIKLLKNSADFLGMNHYTSFYVSLPKPGEKIVHKHYPIDIGNINLTHSESWTPSQSPWLKSAPYGLYHVNMYLAKKYNRMPIIITEHGWSTGAGLEDIGRVNSIREYMKALAYAIDDGVNIKGLAIWSLMDNVEWNAGINERFGLYEVDFDSKFKNRTARLSAQFYRHVIRTGLIEDDWKPTTDNETISNHRLPRKTDKKNEEL